MLPPVLPQRAVRRAADCGVVSAELLALVEALLDLGADAAAQDDNGSLLFVLTSAPPRPLHAANFRRLVLALAAAGAPVNEPHPLAADFTPLALLLQAGIRSGAALLDAGPLGQSACPCSPSCLIEAFVAAGADIALEGPMPLLHAVLTAAAGAQARSR